MISHRNCLHGPPTNRQAGEYGVVFWDTSTELDTEGTVFNVKYSSLTVLHSRASFQQCAVPLKEEAYDKAARYSGTAKSFYLI